MGDPGSIPGSGRSCGGGIGYPLQSSWAALVAQLVTSTLNRYLEAMRINSEKENEKAKGEKGMGRSWAQESVIW